MNAPSSDRRVPVEHGKTVSELVDLGGPIARIERTTYVGSQWTTLLLIIPAADATDEQDRSIKIHLNDEQLKLFLEKLAWPK